MERSSYIFIHLLAFKNPITLGVSSGSTQSGYPMTNEWKLSSRKRYKSKYRSFGVSSCDSRSIFGFCPPTAVMPEQLWHSPTQSCITNLTFVTLSSNWDCREKTETPKLNIAYLGIEKQNKLLRSITNQSIVYHWVRNKKETYKISDMMEIT